MKIINKLVLSVNCLIFLVFTACNTTPVIVPDISTTASLRADTIHDRNGWGWILWYLPVLFLVAVWGWNKYVKNCKQESETP